jgi:hypothetical protein
MTQFLGITHQISHFVESNTHTEILHYTHIVESNFDIVYQTNITYSVLSNIISKDRLEILTNSTNPNN